MIQRAYFAGGCFWCITPCFKMIGASQVIAGYSGGNEINPSYLDVKHQKTKHRETVEVIYDDEKLSYDKLVRCFLLNVDPFDGGGQYIDRGFSYTLAIYVQNEAEKQIAKLNIETLEQKEGKKVQIAIENFKTFYKAEEEHQDYYLKHPQEFDKELRDSGRKK